MMRLLASMLLAAGTLLDAAEVIPVQTAVEQKRVTLTATGNGRDTLHLQITARDKMKLSIPAGTRFQAENGEAQIALRLLEIETGADVDAILPSAADSSANTASQRALSLVSGNDPKLAKLLELFAQQNDLPRPTAQLAVFLLIEDLTWTQWKKWMEQVWAAEKPPKAHPTPAEVAQAVDAIAFARLTAPDHPLAILRDEEFKRLALRNPWARGKAMALYGLSVEDAITGDSSLPVDLGKLLHTSPNDNCPICRQRNKGPAEIP